MPPAAQARTSWVDLAFCLSLAPLTLTQSSLCTWKRFHRSRSLTILKGIAREHGISFIPASSSMTLGPRERGKREMGFRFACLELFRWGLLLLSPPEWIQKRTSAAKAVISHSSIGPTVVGHCCRMLDFSRCGVESML